MASRFRLAAWNAWGHSDVLDPNFSCVEIWKSGRQWRDVKKKFGFVVDELKWHRSFFLPCKYVLWMVCSNALQEWELAQMCPAGGSWIMRLAGTVNSQILVTSSDEVTQDESQVEGWWALLWFGDDCLCDGTSVGGRMAGPFLRSALLVGCHGQSDRYLSLVSLGFFKCKR